jgi:hypothetical protein
MRKQPETANYFAECIQSWTSVSTFCGQFSLRRQLRQALSSPPPWYVSPAAR